MKKTKPTVCYSATRFYPSPLAPTKDINLKNGLEIYSYLFALHYFQLQADTYISIYSNRAVYVGWGLGQNKL